MTSDLRRSALVATINLIENSINTQESIDEILTTYVKQFSMKWKPKSQNFQTKEIINVFKTENHTGMTNEGSYGALWGKNNLISYKGKKNVKSALRREYNQTRESFDKALKLAERA